MHAMSNVKLLHVGTMEQALNAFTRALNADPNDQAWLIEIAEAAHEVLDRYTSPDTVVSEDVAENTDADAEADDADAGEEPDELTCQYCGRESTARIGNIAHERACAKNPNAKQKSAAKKSSRKASAKSAKKQDATPATNTNAKPKKQKKARKAKISCACGRTMGENGFNGYHVSWCEHAKAGDWEYAS